MIRRVISLVIVQLERDSAKHETNYAVFVLYRVFLFLHFLIMKMFMFRYCYGYLGYLDYKIEIIFFFMITNIYYYYYLEND